MSRFGRDLKWEAKLKTEREAEEAKAKRAIEVHELILGELHQIRQLLENLNHRLSR